MFYWIYDYPNWMIGILFALVFVGMNSAGTLVLGPLLRRWIHSKRNANEMVGFAASGFSVLYGLLLGLLAVAAYQNFTASSDLVDKEASSLGALYRDASAYPAPFRDKLQASLRDYVRYTIDDAWPLQESGVVPRSGVVERLFDEAAAFKPSDMGEEVIHAEFMSQYNKFFELHRQRLADVTAGIPAVLWWVVGLGALLNVMFVWMYKMDIHVQLLLGGMLSLFLGVVIFLIAALDNPFRGAISVGPDSFELIYQNMKSDTATFR